MLVCVGEEALGPSPAPFPATLPCAGWATRGRSAPSNTSCVWGQWGKPRTPPSLVVWGRSGAEMTEMFLFWHKTPTCGPSARTGAAYRPQFPPTSVPPVPPPAPPRLWLGQVPAQHQTTAQGDTAAAPPATTPQGPPGGN